ncbi:MAG: hypothetical protein JRN09_09445 [Nitrososphaerota archaeon]|nr:hypothetical protein [Nitrososphaerota archaeon]
MFAYISNLKAAHPLARDIQFPKLPPKLTESIGIHLLRGGLIPELQGYEFRFGGNEADIIGQRGESRVRIEVKGTTKGFEYFGEKDIKASYLMWFDFEELFRKNQGSFTLCILPYREKRFEKPVKITLAGLKKIEGAQLQWKRYSVEGFLSTISKPGVG